MAQTSKPGITIIADAMLLLGAGMALLTGMLWVARSPADLFRPTFLPMAFPWVGLLFLSGSVPRATVTLAVGAVTCASAGIGLIRRQNWARSFTATLAVIAAVIAFAVEPILMFGPTATMKVLLAVEGLLAAAAAVCLTSGRTRLEFGVMQPMAAGSRAAAIAGTLTGVVLAAYFPIEMVTKGLSGLR